MLGPYRYGRIKPSAARLAALPRLHAAAAMDQLPAPPAELDFGSAAFYAGMLGNDQVCDCTCAGLYGLIQGWSARTLSAPVVATTAEALGLYSTLEGYDPATGRPDDGLDETLLLDYWAKTGVQYASPAGYGQINRLKTYATVDPRNIDHIEQAIWVCGGIYLGCEMPASAQEQTQAGRPWSVPWRSPIEGGHCIVSMKYDANYIYVRTWGQEQAVEWDWWLRYGDAAYAVVNPLWIGQAGKSPDGLDLDSIVADLPYVAS
jgi:hypothetical protein